MHWNSWGLIVTSRPLLPICYTYSVGSCDISTQSTTSTHALSVPMSLTFFYFRVGLPPTRL